MLRGEARVDERPLARFGIVHRKLATCVFEGHDLCGRMIRAGFAVGGIGLWANSGGEPDASLFVHDRIVDARVTIPDGLVTPIRRMPVRQLQR